MQNKKIIYFSSYDDIHNPHYGGGGAVAVHEVAKRLSRHYNVQVLSWNYSGKKSETIEGVSYERFGFPSLTPKLSMLVYQLFLPFFVLNRQYDIWMESFCPPFTTSFLPVFTKKPVIGVVHMLAARDMERKYKLPFHLIQNSGIRVYNQLIVTSEALKKSLSNIHPTGSVTVISNGVSKIVTTTKRKQKYILFLGRIEVDQKGIDLLIAAFKKFHANNKTYRLIIAGTGDQKEITKTKALIRDAGISKDVIMKGRVSGKEKETVLKEAAALVISSRFETYSLVALEAMAHGTPVVCFAIDGLSWIPKKAAQKVKAFDKAGLAEALETVVTKSIISEKMMKEGNKYAKQFTWDNIARQYEEYIENILKN